MEWLEAFFENWVLDAARHWLLAFGLGVLVSWWMLTMLHALLSILSHLLRLPISRVAIYGILILCLAACVVVAWYSHAALDGFVTWWHTPLGPPLNYDGGV